MTAKELAEAMNGRQYRREITREEARESKDSGLVVIFGASDDLCELCGAINDEIGAWDGTTFLIDREGVIPSERDDDWTDEEMVNYFRRKASPTNIEVAAKWCPSGLDASWLIVTQHAHETFDIFEDDELFCRGIVIDLGALS